MIGKLIVLDGADGAGKATQTKFLKERLIKDGYEVETLDFPQYKNNQIGGLIRECLDGKRGDFLHLDARIASTLYAADRYESKALLLSWLRDGKVVLLDRYVSANMLHQGAKIKDEAAAKEFILWLDELEYGVFGLPRPEVVLYLAVPLAIREKLKKEAIKEGKHSATLDQAEADLEHQAAAEAAAERLVSELNNWVKIDCTTKDGAIKLREEIAELVYGVAKRYL